MVTRRPGPPRSTPTALAAVGPATTIVLRAAAGAKLAAGKLRVRAAGGRVGRSRAAGDRRDVGGLPGRGARGPGAAGHPARRWRRILPRAGTLDIVVDLALEALSLAGLRTVDVETGAWLGRMLPAVLLPDGDASDVIAAPPLPLLQVDAEVLERGRATLKELG